MSARSKPSPEPLDDDSSAQRQNDEAMAPNGKDADVEAVEANDVIDDLSADDSRYEDRQSQLDRANLDKSELDKSELEKAQDRVLRLQAELENLRRRSARELNEHSKYASLPLVRDLLPVVDNIDRAIEAAKNSQSAEGLLEGFGLVAQQVKSVLGQHHCTEIDASERPFDPNLHEAILQQPSTEHPPGTVIQVAQVGYQLHDRVIRPSQVIVSTSDDSGDSTTGEDLQPAQEETEP